MKKKSGFHYVFGGIGFLKDNKPLWKFAWVPSILTILLLIPTLWFSPDFFNWLTDALQPGILNSDSLMAYFNSDANMVLRWLAMIFGGLLLLLYTLFVWVIIFGAILMMVVLLFVLILKILSAPFNDLLAEGVEKIHDNSLSEHHVSFWKSMKVALISETQRFFVFLAVAVPIYLFSFLLPGLGHALAALAIVIYSCFWYAYDAMSYSMDRYGWSLGKRVRFLLKHPFAALTFGIAIYAVAIIPLLNLLVMPVFVVGGTRMFVDLIKQSPDLTKGSPISAESVQENYTEDQEDNA